MIARCGLTAGDPSRPDGTSVGKVMRVRSVLAHAIDQAPTAGAQFVKMYVEQIRALGGFREGDPNCPGAETIVALRRAFKNVGYGLDADGVLRPALFEGLEGTEMTEALWSYVRRARTGAEDPELVIGTSSTGIDNQRWRFILLEPGDNDWSLRSREEWWMKNVLKCINLVEDDIRKDMR